MYLVYHTDNQHSYASRDVIAVCASFKKAITLCNHHAIKTGYPILSQDVWNLNNLKQTQGYHGEYDIEEVTINTLF